MNLTVQEAKTLAQDAENKIVAFIPESLISNVDQRTEAWVFGCTDGRVRWPGSTTVHFAEPQDTDTLVRDIHDNLREEPHHTLRFERVDNLYDRVIFVDPTGTSVIVREHDDSGLGLSISAWSPCFELAKGQTRFDAY